MASKPQSHLIPEALAVIAARPGLPSWLISAVAHLAVLLVLAASLSRPQPGVRRTVSLSFSTVESPGDAGGQTPEVQIPAPLAGGANSAPSAASSGGVHSLAEAVGDSPPVDPSAALPAVAAAGQMNLENGHVGDASPAAGGPHGRGNGKGGGLNVGGEGRTGVFGTEGKGYKFVYVFDRSASMGGSGRNALAAAKTELLASLDNLEKTHQFQIIFYNEQVFKFNPSGDPDRLIFATDQNKALARKFVASITPDDGTDHEKALSAAIKLRPDVIFFLTDADEPKIWPAQLARLHRMAAGITINCIEFGFGPQTDRDNFLVQLARQNGGAHAYVDVSKLFPVAGN